MYLVTIDPYGSLFPSGTLGRKLRAGVFGTDEVEKLIDVLNIENPNEIFFVKK